MSQHQAPDVRAVLAGSEQSQTGTTGPTVDASAPIEVTLVLRRRQQLAPEDVLGGRATGADFEERFGADPVDLTIVTDALTAAGVAVVGASQPARTLRVRATAGQLSTLFGTELRLASAPDDRPTGTGQSGRRRQGSLSLPAELDGIVVAVLGLDDRPVAESRARTVGSEAVTGSFSVPELAKVYGFPDGDGTGQTLAIVELGGGFGTEDLQSYFGGLGLPVPAVTAVGVDGATNVPGQDPQGADGEVLLDIEVAGAVAPAAQQVVYFAPNTDAGFLDAVNAAVHAAPTPVAVSISWGQSEDQWTAQARAAMDAAFADACALGVTVTCAAGDNGSGDSDSSGSGRHTDFPASSPHVLACGGTSLTASGGSRVSEQVWDDGTAGGATGGGVSDTFALPSWQSDVGVPAATAASGGRGVPDVAADADPRTGYQVVVDGSSVVYGGTSAVAPLWAGLVARVVQLTGNRTGLIQPVLYAGATAGHTSPGLWDVTEGSNGGYRAAPGWDPCTGLGVPSAALLSVFQT